MVLKSSDRNLVFGSLWQFSGEMGDRFKKVCARFCEKQSQALEVLKTRQRKDPKLASLLQVCLHKKPLLGRIGVGGVIFSRLSLDTSYWLRGVCSDVLIDSG